MSTAYAIQPGETAGQFIARIVRDHAGCSIKNNFDKLIALVGAAETTPAQARAVSLWETNCATFALGVLRAAGVKHPLLARPLVNGMAFTWLVTILRDLGALRPARADGVYPEGALLHYGTHGVNNDHAEFALTPPDEHGGGGRGDNEVTVGHSIESVSWGRPVEEWGDPDALGITLIDVAPHSTDPCPPPDPEMNHEPSA